MVDLKYLKPDVLQSDERVLKTVLKWYSKNAKAGDYVTDPTDRESPYLLKDDRYVKDYKEGCMGAIYPLLTEAQLYTCLQDVTGRQIFGYFNGDNMLTIGVSLEDPMDIREGNNLKNYGDLCDAVNVIWGTIVKAHDIGIILEDYL